MFTHELHLKRFAVRRALRIGMQPNVLVVVPAAAADIGWPVCKPALDGILNYLGQFPFLIIGDGRKSTIEVRAFVQEVFCQLEGFRIN